MGLMRSEYESSFVHDHEEPVFPTEEVFQPALHKVVNFLYFICGPLLPANVQTHINELRDQTDLWVVVDGRDENNNIFDDSPDLRGTVAFMSNEDGKLYFPEKTKASTATHEIFHFLSKDDNHEGTGFFDGQTIWKYYFNESFTDLLTLNTVLDSPRKIFSQPERANRYVAKYLEQGFDPLEDRSRSYNAAFENLTQILRSIDPGRIEGVMSELILNYFSHDIDKAISVFDSFGFKDYDNIENDVIPVVPLRKQVHNSFEHLAHKDLDSWSYCLKEIIPKTDIFSDSDKKAEKKVLEDMIELITLKKSDPKTKVKILFPEFIPDGNGIQIKKMKDGSYELTVNTSLLNLSKYLLPPAEANYTDAYRNILIATAVELSSESGLFNKKTALSAQSSLNKRIEKLSEPGNNYQRTVNSFYKDLYEDPVILECIFENLKITNINFMTKVLLEEHNLNIHLALNGYSKSKQIDQAIKRIGRKYS